MQRGIHFFVVLMVTLAGCKKTVSRSQARFDRVEAPAAASAPTLPPGPPALQGKLAIVGMFADDVYAKVHPLGSSVAIQQTSEAGWSVFAVTAGKRIDLSARLPSKSRGNQVELELVAGTGPEDAWITTMDISDMPLLDIMTWHIGKDRAAQKKRLQLLALGELRPGHLVGLPSHKGPMFLWDDTPTKLETLRGNGPLPTVPTKMRLTTAVFLGEGRMCGLALVPAADGLNSPTLATWVAETDGTSRIVPLDPTLELSGADVVRGPEGECVVMAPDATNEGSTTITRIRRDRTATISMPRTARAPRAAPDGSIWFGDGELARATLTSDDRVEVVAYALPSSDICPALSIDTVAPLGPDDVWAVARCAGYHRGPPREILLHTEAAAVPVTWPAP